MPEEYQMFEGALVRLLIEEFGENFMYTWDGEDGGLYIRLNVWGKEVTEDA